MRPPHLSFTGAAATVLSAALAGWSGCRTSPPPEQLFAEAEALRLAYDQQASQQAIVKYRGALTAWKRTGDTGHAAKAGQGIGATYEQLGALKESLAAYLESLSLSEQSPDRLLESEVRSDVGVARARLGDFDAARQQCDVALDRARRSGGVREEARALNCLGEVDYHRGNSKEALASYRRAEPLWAGLDDTRGRAETLLLLGSAYTDLNDLDHAGPCLSEAMSLWTEVADQRKQALTQLALARLQYFQREYQQALNVLTGLSQRFRTAGDRVWEGACLSFLAYVYEEMGEPRTALTYWGESARLFERAGLQMATLELSVSIGIGYLSVDVDQSLAWFEKTLELARASGNQHMQSWALRYIGLANLIRANPVTAQRYLQQSLDLQRSVEDPRFRAMTLADLGRAHLALGDRDGAVGYFKEALELSQACGDRVAEATVYYDLARAAVAIEDLDAARHDVEAALRIAESLRTEVENRNLRASYFASVHQFHELHMDVLMRLDKVRPGRGLAAAAFEASERARARSLLDSLADARVDLRTGIDPDLLKRERVAKKAFDDWANRRAATTSAADVAAMDTAYRDLEERYLQIEAEMRSRSPRYAALAQPRPLDLREVQQQVLDPETLLLEYALGEERSYLWVVSRTGESSYTLPPRGEIEQAARRVYERLTIRLTATGDLRDRQHAIEQADADFWTEAARLSAMLLGPVARQMVGKRILVVADGTLQYVPFAALPVPGRQDGPVPMVVEHEVVHLPSASVLATVRRETAGRTPPAGVVAVLADPVFERDDPRLQGRADAAKAPVRDAGLTVPRLPATRQEADAICAIAPEGRALRKTDFDASRATAQSRALAGYRIVHFATHGIFDNETPGLSGIMLSTFDAQGQPQDGLLRLHDIYDLQLPVELVVLSACNTALGRQLRGEGLVGVVRGFMYAGAKRVVASLWKVDDEATGELMTRFYRHMLRDGRAAAAALRQAQVEMWQQARWRSPYYWAAFVLQGEWR